ncbi:MAG: hypothetical protein GY841_11855 [FCB group bacterium]|nr:hypothetical protein [FCB group bacterium]
MSRIVITALLLILGLSRPLTAGYHIRADIAGDSAYVDSVITVTDARLRELVGAIPDDSLDIFITATHERFDSLAGNAVPDWGAGVAIPYKRLIVIKSPLILPGDKTLGELAAHEYAHIALARVAGFRRLPRWLDEGLSMYVSAEWGWGDNLAIAQAVALGRLIPLVEIENLNRFGSDKAQLAYSESYLAFKYMLDIYGQSSFHILLNNIRAGRRLDYAFIAATGGDYQEFETEFAANLHGRYNIVTWFFNSNLLWVLLALIVVVGFIMTRVKRKKRMEEIDEYDQYHSTDFDYGKGVEEPDEDDPWN